ncbi:MAG: toxin [Paludibacter sp.]|nr:toxin [Paludibacter sp.]
MHENKNVLETGNTTKEKIQKFLDDFHLKTRVFDIVFLDYRDKNFQSLLKLEISSFRRKEIIKALTVEDYSEGPLPDTLHHISEMWVFGKIEKKKNIYIKISMGVPNSQTICISFHIAEKNMYFPFKKAKK